VKITSILSAKSDQKLQDYALQVDDDAFNGDESAIERGEAAVAETVRRWGTK
jgi:hypothetical protein